MSKIRDFVSNGCGLPYGLFHGGTVTCSAEGAGPCCLGPVRRWLGAGVRAGSLGLADFRDSVPWRQVRARRGQEHYSGSYASATMGGFWCTRAAWSWPGCCWPTSIRRYAGSTLSRSASWPRIDGRVRNHVPDYLLVMAAGTVRLVNVKPAARLDPIPGRVSPPRRGARRGGGAGLGVRAGRRAAGGRRTAAGGWQAAA